MDLWPWPCVAPNPKLSSRQEVAKMLGNSVLQNAGASCPQEAQRICGNPIVL